MDHEKFSIQFSSSSYAIRLNPFTAKGELIDFTLSNARRFYSSRGDPSERVKYSPFLSILVSLWLIIISLMFLFLNKQLVTGFVQKSYFSTRQR